MASPTPSTRGTPPKPSAPALVVGTCHRIALAVGRSLSAHGITVDVAFPEGTPTGSRSFRAVHVLPRMSRPQAVAETLARLVDEHGYDTVFPCGDAVLGVVHDHFASLSSKTRLACPPPATLRKVLDKTTTLELAADLGMAVPRAASPEARTVEQVSAELRFPIIAKPRACFVDPRVKIRYLENESALRAAVEDEPELLDSHLLQEYCPGVGVGVETLIRDGRPVFVFQHRRLQELPIAGGVSVLAEAVEPDPRLVDQALALLRALDWQGVAMVEFRYDAERDAAVLMEVNGRYWGSLALSAAAGLEIPWLEWRALHGEALEESISYTVGARVRWTAGQLQRLAKLSLRRPPAWLFRTTLSRELLALLGSLGPRTKDAVWRLDDLRAGLAEVRQIAQKVDGALPLPGGLRGLLRLARPAKRAYAAAWLGWSRRRLPQWAAERPSRLLVVCHGNIARSAFAAALLRERLAERRLDGIQVSSAGTHASEGRADPRTVELATRHGLDLEQHEPCPLTDERVRDADIIAAMDLFNVADIVSRWPEARDKVCLFGDLAAGHCARAHEVPDPFHGSLDDFERCFARLATLVDEVARHGETRTPLVAGAGPP